MGKTKLRIMNIIYLALSGFALFWYSLNFIQPEKAPFLEFGFSAELTQENGGEFVDSILSGIDGVSSADLFAEGPLKVEADIQIKNKMLVDVWTTSDPVSFVDNLVIEPNVDSLVSQVEPALMRVVKVSAKGSIKVMVEDMLKETLGSGEDLYTKLAEGNPTLNSEEMSKDIGTVIDQLMADDANIDSLSTTLTDTYNKYNEALGNPVKEQTEIKEELEKTLTDLHALNDDGSIDIEKALAYFLETALGSETSGEGGESTEAVLRRSLAKFFQEESEEKPLAKALKNKINELLNDEVKNGIVLGFKAAGIGLAVFMLGWALKFIQCILGFIRKKPYVRKEIIGIVGGIIQFILALVSILFIVLFKFKGLEALTSLPMAGDIIKVIPIPVGALKNFELTFSAMIPGILVLVNFVYSMFYGSAKRKFKREYKESKR